MKNFYGYLFIFMIFFYSDICFGSEPDNRFKQGNWELGVGFSTVGSASPFVGYFLTDNLEGIVHINFSHEDLSGSYSQINDSFGFSSGLTYNFQTNSNFVPMTGLVLSYSHNTYSSNGFGPAGTYDNIEGAVEAGLRFLVGSRASVNIDGRFGYESSSYSYPNIQPSNLDLTGPHFAIGLSYSLFF